MVSFLRHATIFLLFQHAMEFSAAGLAATNYDNDDCCLCDDCDVVSNAGQPLQVSTTMTMLDEHDDDDEQKSKITTCEDLAVHLLLYSNAHEEQCNEQRAFFRDVCCTQDDPSSVLDRDAASNKLSTWDRINSRSGRKLVWSTSQSKPNSYLSWSSSGSSSPASTITNSLAQWASSLFNNVPAGSSNQFINLPPSSPTSSFQFPRPSPFSNGGFSNNNNSFPRPTPSSFTFPPPAPTRPTFTFPAPPPPPAFPTFTTSTGGGFSNNNSGGTSSQAWVNAHNTRRSQYHSQNGVSFVPIKWSNELAASADAYTQRLLNGFSGCNIQHNFQGDSYGGENLALQVTQSTSTISPDGVLRLWYEDEINLSYPANGHLTQVVWRSTEYVGCAVGTKRNSNGGYCHIQTCRYLRPGNCNGATSLLQTSTPCGPECPIREGCF